MNTPRSLQIYISNSAVAAVLFFSACSVFDPPIEDGGSPDSADDGKRDVNLTAKDGSNIDRDASDQSPVGPWWIERNDYGCETARMPTADDRPANEDLGNELPPIYFAISRVRLGATKDDESLSMGEDEWLSIGFDMDGVCTNSESCTSDGAIIDEPACLNETITPYDGSNCRDNELGKLSQVAAQASELGETWGFSERDWNCELHRGGFSVIIKISKYNGKRNDRSVQFDMYTSVGLQTLPGWNCRDSMDKPLDPEWYTYPSWLPSLHWVIAQQSISSLSSGSGQELPSSKTADHAGFVRDGYFFASIPDGRDFWLNGERTPTPGFRYIMHRGVMVGQLVHNPDDTWTVQNGTLAFVILPDEYLQGFQEIGFCENLCDGLDVLVEYNKTRTDTLYSTTEILPDVPCDALSMGLDFDARQVTVTKSDIEEIKDPEMCPNPRHPDAPRQGCTCQEDGTTCLLEEEVQ